MINIKNKDVLNYYDNHGKSKCVEYLKELNKANQQPSEKAYIKSIEKLLTGLKKIKKSIKRDGPGKYESIIDSFYIFPQYDESKKVPKIKTIDLLDLNASFKEEKSKNSILTEKIDILEKSNDTVSKNLAESANKLVICNKKLKRTAGREIII